MTTKTPGQLLAPPREARGPSRKKVLGSAAAASSGHIVMELSATGKISGKSGTPVTVVYGRDYSDRVLMSRAGLPAVAVDMLADRLGLSRVKFMQALQLKGSTIERRLAAKQALSSAETDKLYRVEKVLARAAEVLEDESAAEAWIQREIRSLGGVSPLSLLDTDAGVDLVMDTLGRIEYGIAA
jgi:putative toxin-antitoxin system antitoxin component (TIGR02293 family)